jgi:uncharacterized membrane protein
MDLARIARHLFVLPGAVKRTLPADSMKAIEQAISASESQHGGEIRFAVEPALDPPAIFRGQSARERAIEVFSLLQLWDTAARNGVLIYLLLADHDIEIVADRGVGAKVSAQEWEAVCRTMEASLRRGEFRQGLLDGIGAVSRLLALHFPPRAGDRDELPDRPVSL